MSHYTSTKTPALHHAAQSLQMGNGTNESRETAFDPFHYEFDAETMIEPFTYFHNGPTESRGKSVAHSSRHFPRLSIHHRSGISSPDESPQSFSSPSINEQQIYGLIQLKAHRPNTPQHPSSYPKTICTHCKSHQMPECLYTSHSMYDESGALFCPVLKKCHCATCIRVTHPSQLRDDESDDENHLRLPPMNPSWTHVRGVSSPSNSYRSNSINTF